MKKMTIPFNRISMRKLSSILILLSFSLHSFCQESNSVLLNKNGINILPEKGEIGIGIDAVPLLNLLNEKGESPGFNFVNDIPSISIKYFLSNKSALILDIIIGFSSIKDGDNTNYTIDSDNSYGFNFGFEKRLGKSRVQGFYGIEGGVLFAKSKTVEDNETVFAESSILSFGADGFLGAEYFIAAKLSIGGKFTWGPTYLIGKNLLNDDVTSTFSLEPSNASGALILSFYF